MQQISRVIQSQHCAERLYDLVNDTDSYQSFIPFCQESRVLRYISDTEKQCLLNFSRGGMECRIVTNNRLVPKKRIDIVLEEGPFSVFEGTWEFEDNAEGCLVTLHFKFQFKHALASMVFNQVFHHLSSDMVRIFCEKADDVLH